jgi:hypothetical protein
MLNFFFSFFSEPQPRLGDLPMKTECGDGKDQCLPSLDPEPAALRTSAVAECATTRTIMSGGPMCVEPSLFLLPTSHAVEDSASGDRSHLAAANSKKIGTGASGWEWEASSGAGLTAPALAATAEGGLLASFRAKTGGHSVLVLVRVLVLRTVPTHGDAPVQYKSPDHHVSDISLVEIEKTN